MEKNLKLKVNQDKSKVSATDDIDFLGFTFKGTRILWSDKAFQQFKYRVKRLTGRSWFVSMAYRYNKLSQYIRGWMNYFGISENYRPIPEIDGWLRRRVRMCYWKQWRCVRTKVRNMLKLGTYRNVAIPMCLSRKGPWKCARTLATKTGMTNQWLKDQGLVSVKELWVIIIRLRPDKLCETPRADPHAGCCGGWGRNFPGYPIKFQSTHDTTTGKKEVNSRRHANPKPHICH